MKKTICTLLLAGAGFGASAQIAHWNFNGTANDAGPNAMNGTTTNCTYVSGMSGQPNTAIRFNGTNSMMDVPYHPATATATYTIRAVVRPDGFYSGLCEGSAIFMNESDVTSYRKMLLITDNMYNDCGHFEPDLMRFQAGTHGVNPNPYSAQQYSGSVLPGHWYCVISTYDGDTLKIYVDGILKMANAVPNQYMPAQAGISIGYFANGLPGGYPYYFNGAIDDIAFYDHAVPVSEIPSLCSDFQPGDGPSPTAVPGTGKDSRPAPFPNPADGVLFVPVQGGVNIEVYVSIFSLEGKLLHTETAVPDGAATLRLPTTSLAPGCYLVEIKDAAGRTVKPFTKR